MALEIRKKSLLVWKFIDTVNVKEFIPSRFSVNTLDNTVTVIYKDGANSQTYDLSQIELYDLGSISPFPTFVTIEAFMLKLEQMNCPCFPEISVIGGVQSVVAGTNVTVDNTDPLNPIVSASGGGGSSIWGGITGNLSDQVDLQTALNNKLDKVTTNDVEKVYIKNADGTQGMKSTSDLGGSLILCKVFKGNLTPITTNGVKTYCGSIYIGNIILPGDIIEVRMAVAKVSGSSSVNPRASLSTTMGAMTHDLVVGILGTITNQQSLNKTSVIAWSNNQHYNALGYGSRYTDEGGAAGGRIFSTMPFNFTDDLWLDFSIQNNGSGNTTYLDFAYIKIYRNL